MERQPLFYFLILLDFLGSQELKAKSQNGVKMVSDGARWRQDGVKMDHDGAEVAQDVPR